MRNYRCTFTLLWSLPIALGAYLLRPSTEGMSDDRFYALKSFGPAVNDVVVLGDSRVNQGVSPAAMTTLLPGKRVLNFGFDSAGFNCTYLRGGAEKLSPQSRERLLVLGISPFSLTRKANENNSFLQSRKLDVVRRWNSDLDLSKVFAPYNLESMLRTENERTTYIAFHADGWDSRLSYPELPLKNQSHYRLNFADGNTVSPKIVDDLVQCINDLTRQGIKIVAFRMPAYKALQEVENESSGFDEADLALRLKAAGVVWLSFPVEGYHYYDGSHMQATSAKQFSLDLSRALLDAGVIH